MLCSALVTRRTSAAAAALVLTLAPALAQLRQALAEAQTEMLAEAADDNFGWSVAVAGDVNGDGISDIVVGAIYNDSGAGNAGEIYVFLGGPIPSTIPFMAAHNTRNDDHLGVSVAGAGDVNGDGFADVIAGARLADLGGNASGAAYIWFGGPAMDPTRDVILAGEAAHDWFGQSVSGAGDVNGDGFDDVIVGAPHNDRGGSSAGAAYVFLGGPSMDAIPDVILVGEVHDDQFGWSVDGIGDANGDGFDDVIVGARLHCVDTILCTGQKRARGRAYLFLGGSAMDAVPDLVLNGDAADDWFGNTVAGIGDVNGDGYPDFAVGAIYADPIVGGTPRSAAGTTNVWFGGPALDAVRDAVIPGSQANGQSGFAIAAAGDVDGDGFGDFWTTEHFFADGPRTGAGKAYLIAGGLTPGLPPLATAVGEGQDVQLGQSVAGGDVAGWGGFGDGIIGQVYSRDVGVGSGKSFVLSPFCVSIDADERSVVWAACGPFASFNLYRGSILADLRVGSSGVCRSTGLSGPSTPMDAEVPATGDAFFYAVTGVRASLEGAHGFRSDGERRRNTAPCP